MSLGGGRGPLVVDAAGALRGFVREAGGCAVVDGGLGTELEAHGADLHDALWSAKCLASAPHLIRKVHLDYLQAGANVIISASYQVHAHIPRTYIAGHARAPFHHLFSFLRTRVCLTLDLDRVTMQATIEGFQSRGFSRDESEELLRRSLHVAQEARRVFAESDSGRSRRDDRRPPVLVAASIGSYGAYRADGSEYSGDYGKSVTKDALKNFHRRRLQVLAGAGPDLIAFETIPNKLEAQVHTTVHYTYVAKCMDGMRFVLHLHWCCRAYMASYLDRVPARTQAYAELLEENGIRIPAWFSFTSKDGVHAASGDPITECAAVADSCPRVAAVGVNCTAPRFIHGLILSIKKVIILSIWLY